MALQQYQRNHIEAWQASGLSQAAYCRQYKLNAKTFSNWLRAYRNKQVSFEVAPMIPVEIKPSVSLTGSLWLRWPGGHALELPADISPQWLGELLKCLD